MPKYLTTALLFCLLFCTATAQNIENTINLQGDNFPAERMHIHFDKELYLPGETIWFKAYLLEENLPSKRSTNLYISLYDEDGKALQQKMYPIINAAADGYFDIADTIKTSQLVCRAYTSWMLNFDTSFLFTKAIKLFNNTATDTIKKNLLLRLQFFPEAGDMLQGERNTIAFKANYSNGLPFEINGQIKNQQTGEVISSIKSLHDGMGKFDIEPQPGEKYYVEWTDNNSQLQQTFLPEAKTTGLLFKVAQQKTKLYYNVVNKLAVDTLHILAYMYQKVIYKTSLPLKQGERYTGIIPLDSFPTGAMQLTVFNTQWQPVAERISFINNNNYTLPATITHKEISLQKRGKNTIEIAVQDTMPANMSLSITDADFNNDNSSTNIFSNLLLSGDIRGYVHNPAYYFTSNTDAALKEQLDLVMLTHGWRRYNWDNILAAKMPVINTAPDNYLSVYGQMSSDALSKIKKDETVTLIVKTKDSTTNYYFVQPDAKGLLKTTGLIFYDTAKLYYSFNTAKQYNKQLAFGASNYTLPVRPVINNYSDYLIKDTTGTNPTLTLYKYYNENKNNQPFNASKTLQGVVVTSGGWRNWKNDPLVKLDERYATGAFSGGATGYSLDLLHDEKAWTKLDIFTYMRHQIPGLKIGGYNALNGRSLFYLSSPVFVYIDEHEATSSDLENISIAQIAYVKLIPRFAGRGAEPGQAALPAVLSVYTKKGDDLIDRTPKESDLGMVKIPGYSPVKQFYSPDYAENKNALGNDSRTTLLWQPYIFTDKNNLKIPVSFYNNDFSKKIKIVLEGFNEEGKLIHIEKIIE